MQAATERVCRDKLDQAVKALVMVLSSRDGLLRKAAREAVVVIGAPAVPALIGCLADGGKTARWEAAKALGRIADPSAAPALVGALEDDDFGIRWLAADALIRLGSSSLQPLLDALLQDPDCGRLREGTHHVLRALSSRGGPVARILAPLLEALDAFGREDVVPHIKAALQALASMDHDHREPGASV